MGASVLSPQTQAHSHRQAVDRRRYPDPKPEVLIALFIRETALVLQHSGEL